MELSRRDFLKMGGSAALVSGAGLALSGCGSSSKSEKAAGFVVGASDINFTVETDVLIIGTGIAGLSAGMVPVKAGKKVTYIEKLSIYGGESKLSCGFMFYSGTAYQAQYGIKGTVDEAWELVKDRLSTSKLYSEAWFGDWNKRKFYATTSFMDSATADFGAQWQKPASPEVTNLASTMVLPKDGIGNPTSVLQPIRDGLEKMGAKFMYDTKALALIKDEAGAVIGLRARDLLTGENVDIKASKVCICTGGFSCNQEMVATYLPNFTNIGNLTVNSMGEGQLLGFAAGAKAYGMENPAYMMGDIPQATTWGYFTPIIMVLPDGKRFINEGQSHDTSEVVNKAGFGEWWVIFSDNAFNVEQIASSVKANLASNPTRYIKAATIEELAVGMRINAATLAESVGNHNDMAAAGKDTEFGKTRHLKPVEGPFHALRLMTRRYKTYGGFLTSIDSEVLDDNNQPIPNLYAAGSCVPWSTSDLSPNAGNGYMAGESITAALGQTAAK